jgi:hypothetical protein
MSESGAREPVVRFCPYCGNALGSFFGHRMADGTCWCERCQESFRVSSVKEDEESEE